MTRFPLVALAYERFCKGTAPGGGRVLACLSKQKLSDACKKVVADAKK